MASVAKEECSKFDTCLSRLAELVVRVGLNLRPGQELVMTAPLEADDLAGRIAEHAYRCGAGVVTCLYEDPASLLARLRYADESTLGLAPYWLSEGVTQALESGAARLQLLGPRPDLLAGVPMARTLRLHASLAKAGAAEAAILAKGQVNASRIPCATSSWARTVYPHAAQQEATSKLWDAIFALTRADLPNPQHALSQHLAILDARSERLQELGLTALHFRDGMTDLMIALADSHRWCGATAVAGNGVVHAPTLAIEEVLVATDPGSAQGRVALTRPLALAGTDVCEAVLELRNGRVVSIAAAHGGDVLEALLAGDADSRRIGQVGLAPAQTPLSKFGPEFHNPMLDRGTGCHFAFGTPEPACPPDGLHEDGAVPAGFHLDCVFGGTRINVDGIGAGGKVEPIMRDGRLLI